MISMDFNCKLVVMDLRCTLVDLVFNSPRLICSPKGLASPEQTATGKDFSNPFIVSGLLINQMVIKSTIVFELKLLASPEQTATGKDKSNPLIVADLLINQMVIRCTIVFELKHLATPVVMAIGKETSFPLVSMIHLSQELIRLEVMRIVCNDYELMVDWSFVVSKIWYISRWCYSWILDSWFFVAATNIVCNVYVLMVAWSYVDTKIWRLSRWCFSWNLDTWFFVAAGWKRDVFWSQISAWFYS